MGTATLYSAISTQVYVPVGIAIAAAGYPIAQQISELEGRLARTAVIAGTAIGVVAVAACGIAVYLSTRVPPRAVPGILDVLTGLGFGVILMGSAGILLAKVIPTRWAAVLSVVAGVVILFVAIALTRSVGGSLGTRIEVAPNPRAIAIGSEAVWIVHANGVVSRIDPSSNSLVGREIEIPISDSAELFHIAAGLGYIWVMDDKGWVYKVDPDSHSKPERIARIGGEEGEMTIRGRELWVNGYSGAVAARIDPAEGEKKSFELRASTATDLTIGGGFVWVANDHDRQITQLDPQSGRIVGEIPLTGEPNDIFYGEEMVFATFFYDQKLVAIDPDTGTELWTTRVGRQPSGIAVFGGTVWASNYASDTVTEVDIDSGEVKATVRTPRGPADVVAGFGSLWMPDFDSGAVTRINVSD